MDKELRAQEETILNELLPEQPPTSTVHRVRALMLESAASLERHLDEVLASEVARSYRHALQLAADVMCRLSVDVRIRLLRELLERNSIDEDLPFLVPVLRRLFDFRNALAHGWTEPVRLDRRPLVLRLHSARRGALVVTEYPLLEVAWLVDHAAICHSELTQVWASIVPDDPAWHGDESWPVEP